MQALLFLLLSGAAPSPRAAVVDISAPDAVYEDVSRAQADRVVEVLNQAGFDALRVEESELPEQGCHAGPCLEEVGRKQKANVVVTVDAVELNPNKTGVVVAALWAVNGQPLAIRRYTVHAKDKSAKTLATFAKDALSELKKAQAPGRKSR